MAQPLSSRNGLLPKKLANSQAAKFWLENKIARIRALSEKRAARAAKRFIGPAGVGFLVAVITYSLILPKDPFQKNKELLIKNPDNIEKLLFLAEELLNNNQFKEAEKILLLAEKSPQVDEQILGKQTSIELEQLWQRKHHQDPEDIRRLIAAWEKISQEKPFYRDAYLQLANLHYCLGENDKAKQHLQEALALDPNFEPGRKLKAIIDQEK